MDERSKTIKLTPREGGLLDRKQPGTATLDETNWEQDYDDAVAAGEGEPPDLYVGMDVDANKRIRALHFWESELKRVHGLANEEIARVTHWLDQHDERIKKRIAWNEQALKAYLWGTGKKSIDLPHGQLRRRKGVERIDVVQEEVFLDWDAKTGNGKMTRVKQEPNKKAILSYVRNTGEEPPGVELNRAEDAVSENI